MFMKTKDFIEMLHEADPKGDAYLRFPDGIPFFAERKPGYYDGAYDYIENGNYIRTKSGHKVDVYFKTMEDFIDEHHGDIDVLSRIMRLEEANDQAQDEFWKKVKTIAAEVKNTGRNIRNEMTLSFIKSVKNAVILEEAGDFYTVRDSVKSKISSYNIEIILKSGCFTKNETENGTFWVL